MKGQPGQAKVLRRSLFVVAVVAALLVAGIPVAAAKVRRPTLAWDPGIEDIAHAVERLRGLEFDAPVPIDFGDQHKASGFARYPKAYLEREARHLEAVGLLPPGNDYARARARLGAGGSLGEYDPTSKRITVSRRRFNALTKVIVAHELTHALDDQHFDFDRAEAARTGLTGSAAYRAAVEGDARRVEDLYFEHLPRHERRAARRQYAALAAGYSALDASTMEWPSVLSDVPYTVGKELTRFEATRSKRSLENLLRHAPKNDAAVLDPLDDLRSWTSPHVALQDGERRDGHWEELGAVELYLLFASRIPVGLSFDTARGIDGASSAYFRRDGVACARLAVRTRPGMEQTVIGGLDAWIAAFGSTSSARSGSPANPIVTSCGATTPLVPRTIRAAELALAARTRVLSIALAGTSTTRLACLGRAALDDSELLRAAQTPQLPLGDGPLPVRGVLQRAQTSCAAS